VNPATLSAVLGSVTLLPSATAAPMAEVAGTPVISTVGATFATVTSRRVTWLVAPS
jgi:hypothetical protein